MPDTPRRPGPESTLADVRAQLIDAGIQLLRARGVDVGLGDISLSDTIAAAGVTRSTAYRSLASEELAPQAVLHRELLSYLLTRYTQGESVRALEAVVAEELERNQRNLASDDIADRTQAMRAIIRVGANASYQGVIDSPERSILTATYGALRSSGQTDWRHEALAQGERRLTEIFTDLYLGLIGLFGYEVKPEFSIDQFSTAGASLVEGMAMRHDVNPHVAMMMRPTGNDGEAEEWSLFAVAFEALFMGMFKPTNPDEPIADLSRY